MITFEERLEVSSTVISRNSTVTENIRVFLPYLLVAATRRSNICCYLTRNGYTSVLVHGRFLPDSGYCHGMYSVCNVPCSGFLSQTSMQAES